MNQEFSLRRLKNPPPLGGGVCQLCEVKFKKDKIGKKILEEMEEKRKGLKIPRHFSIRPVLIHVNGVADSVLEENYFDKVIDFSQLLG